MAMPATARVTSLQRSFVASPAAFAPGCPYPVGSSSSSHTGITIPFCEFRGTGPPSSDFGSPGDVYVDCNPRLHALYWRELERTRYGAGSWTRYTHILLDQHPLHRYLAAHPWARDPETADLFLWIEPGPGGRGITWLSADEIGRSRLGMVRRGIAVVEPGTLPDVHALVSELLQRMIAAEREREREGRSMPSKTWPPAGVPGSSSGTLTREARRGSISVSPGISPAAKPHSHRRSSIQLPFRPSSSSSHGSASVGPRSPGMPPTLPPPRQILAESFASGAGPSSSAASYTGTLAGPGIAPDRYPTRTQADPSLAAMMIRSPQMAPVAPRPPASGHGPPAQYSAETKALDDMRRAQGAEHRSKQELKSKSRELSKLRQKEKDVISMSYHYQKRERELVAALEATEQRSSAELQEMRTVLASLQRQAESARSETQRAVDQVQRTQNELAEIQREMQVLQSRFNRGG